MELKETIIMTAVAMVLVVTVVTILINASIIDERHHYHKCANDDEYNEDFTAMTIASHVRHNPTTTTTISYLHSFCSFIITMLEMKQYMSAKTANIVKTNRSKNVWNF